MLRNLAYLLFLVTLAATGMASAQETPATFEFSFSNPGARSLGLGGAFAGLADDATAAYANPAGLVQLARPEISAEARHWSYSTPYTAGGRYEGDPTGIGIDTDAALRTASSSEDLSGLSFLSFVYPKGKWSLAVYGHQLAKFRARTETQGLFHSADDGTDLREFDRRWFTDLDIASYGVAGAYRVHERLSLGAGLVHYDGQLDAPFEWYATEDDSLASLFGINPFLPKQQVVNGNMAFDGTDWGINGGFLWSVSEQWSIGGFYRQGPEFDLTFDIRTGPAWNILSPPAPPAAPDTLVLSVKGSMSFLDGYGFGVIYRAPEGKFTVGFEWDHVEYSTIFDSFEVRFAGGFDDAPDLNVQLAADDGNELHLGAEYAFLDVTPIVAIRAGIWRDPDHSFHSTVTGNTDDDLLHRALFPPGEDQIHYATGVGLAFTNFQIDLGLDFSELVDTISLSAIYSF